MTLLTLIICFLCLSILLVICVGYNEFEKNIKTISFDLLIAEIESRKSYVKIDEISPRMIQAVVCVEDHRFFTHKGVDLISILRAILYNLKYNELAQGGSTITQQLCKNLFFTNKKTFKRKIAEIFAARYIEKKYSKLKILELYLNIIYFGCGYYGIKEASLGYFQVEPKQLNLNKSTLLAGTIQAPSYYNLKVCGDKEKARQNQVIRAVLKYKNIGV